MLTLPIDEGYMRTSVEAQAKKLADKQNAINQANGNPYRQEPIHGTAVMDGHLLSYDHGNGQRGPYNMPSPPNSPQQPVAGPSNQVGPSNPRPPTRAASMDDATRATVDTMMQDPEVAAANQQPTQTPPTSDSEPPSPVGKGKGKMFPRRDLERELRREFKRWLVNRERVERIRRRDIELEDDFGAMRRAVLFGRSQFRPDFVY